MSSLSLVFPSFAYKKTREKKMAARDPGARTTSLAQDLARPFFSRGFFRVSLEGQSERGTTRSLQNLRFL